MCFRAACLASLLCALVSGGTWAQGPNDPLRFVPPAADAFVKLENPRQLYEAVYNHEVVQDLLKIDGIAALYDTTNFRRLLQFIGYFEKQLGHDRLDLLDKLAGGGVVVTAQFEQKAVLGVVEARDEELLKRFVDLSRKIIHQELARLDNKLALSSDKYRDLETFHLGGEVHAARVGAALIFSNKKDTLHTALDGAMDKHKNGRAANLSATEIKAHLPERPLLWGALNLEQVRKIPAVKDALNSLGLDPVTMFAIGGLVDVIKRSPYVCAGLARDGKNFQARIAMPRGRQGMAPLAAMFLPEKEPGTPPLLQPPRVMTSTAYFLDLNRFYENRHKIMTPEQAKGIDKFEAETAKYLKGISLGTILKQAGKYHRIISAIPDKSPYQIKPALTSGAFGIVLDERDPEFGKSMDKILRGAALVAGFQYGVKMVEEKHGGATLVTYYFPEKGKFPGDDNNFRFNFSPCFAQVGKQFIISSTVELGRDLIDSVNKDNKEGSSPATQRTYIYGTGVAANLRSSEEILMSQYILGQAMPAAQARKQLEELIRLVERLGQVHVETRYEPQEFRLDMLWQYDHPAVSRTR